MTDSELLKAYESSSQTYSSFASKLRLLLEELLGSNLQLHSVTARSKSFESLAGKLERGDGKYRTLSDITDLVGVRVITYLHDDVDKVASILAHEFSVDPDNSVDKRALHDPDRFGYMSLHSVLRLNDGRARLAEYRTYLEIPFEVQIRSILQHTWAEIEHDLGYKSTAAIPVAVRRRFSRLAGLLELADLEFAGIRDELTSYRADVQQQISRGPSSAPLDQTSLATFLSSSEIVSQMDRKIAAHQEAKLGAVDDKYVGTLSVRLQGGGVSNLVQLEELILSHQAETVAFAFEWMQQPREILPAGISLFYLGYVLAAQGRSVEEIEAHRKSVV